MMCTGGGQVTKMSGASTITAGTDTKLQSKSPAKKPLAKPVFVSVSTLTPDSRGINLKVKVDTVNMVVERLYSSKSSGSEGGGKKLQIAEARVGDHSGCILLTARGPEQISLLHKGASLIIRNAKIEMFRSFMRLSVDKWGLIEAAQPTESADFNFTVNLCNNMSLVEYELVPNTIQSPPPTSSNTAPSLGGSSPSAASVKK